MKAKLCHTIALFGEAEKGQFKKAYKFHDLSQLVDICGNPPPNSQGLYFAIQSILYHREVIFFRVEEEGFSVGDYFFGLKYLQDFEKVKRLHAIYLPGTGDPKIINISQIVCQMQKCFLITSQKDLYDYLTT